ncbi:PREDICTED: putative RNA polymerase II subunit B1 CTD phosphatase RPAP2 [Polistes dominula]|uniref:RNA polymerase II subunit B1 CTD phosphatase RPAP2 homolog n=1 Tax=Polistes dominula TaxID=743375 RepID=A0ABM1J7K8_POLDO|nr:PREDICTED: putative RNA polymerase II subunit B1 CTD phosphatase RPAP2 [Polistes dominula]
MPIKKWRKLSKAQVKLAIIKKKQLEVIAFKIVEQLLEPIVEPQWLLQNLQHINRSHMEDVIEERAIEKLCGYVLCKNPITVLITQQFHISTKRNKVYDVTKRKNFCSSHCYAACNYLLQQMLTSPLWFRDKEKIPVFHLLSSKEDMLGDEVLIKDSDIPKKNDNEYIESTEKNEENNILDTVTNACNQLPKSNDKVSSIKSSECTVLENKSSKHCVPKDIQTEDSEVPNNKSNINLENHQNTMTNKKARNLLKNNNCCDENFNEQAEIIQKCYEIPVLGESLKIFSDNEENTHIHTRDKIVASMPSIQIVERDYKNNMKTNEIVIKSENIFEDKKLYPIENEKNKYENLQNINDNNVKKKETSNNLEQLSTKFYTLTMHVEKNIKEWITENTLSFLQGNADTRSELMKHFTQQEKYLQLCTKLNKLELIDKKENRTDLSNYTLKPLPDFSTLEKEAKKMNLRVHAFYNGRMIIDPHEKIAENKEPSEPSYLLPLVDSVAPKALRRKIFLDKLHKILSDLLNMLAESTKCNSIMEYIYDSSHYVSVKGLVNTFSLSATNIVFKTAEWILVGLIIIKMLSIINPQLKALLATKQASMYISMILMSYKLDSYYLDRFIIELTNNLEIFKIK